MNKNTKKRKKKKLGEGDKRKEREKTIINNGSKNVKGSEEE